MRFGAHAMAAAMSMASMRACDAMLPALSSDFDVPVGVAARSISAFALAYGLMQLAYGPLGDRFGKLRVITFALTACAVANVTAAVAPTMPALVLARGLSGAAAAGVIPMSMAVIGDTIPLGDRQRVLARFFLATIGGMIGGQWMSGLVADWLHWRAVFWVLATGSGIAAIAVRMQGTGLVSGLPAGRSFGEQIRAVLARPRARLVFAVTAIEGLFTLTGFAFVPTYLHGHFGLGLGAAGAVMAMYGVGGLAYVALSGVLIRRMGSDALAALGGMLLGAAFAIVAIGPRWEWSVPGCFLGGLGFYMLHNTLQTQATEVFPPSRGTAVGLFAASLFLGQAIGMTGAVAVAGALGEQWLFAVAAVALPVLGMAFGGRLRADGPIHRTG